MGPAAFITAWAVLGRADRYDPTRDAISRLAAVHAPNRTAMTGALVVLGAGMAAYSVALRSVAGAAWLVALGNGVLTLGVAALPLGGSHDTAHGVVAGLGYVTLAAVPVLAAPGMARRGRRHLARVSVAAGVVSGACLFASVAGARSGLFQRLGLTVAQLWVVVSALVLASSAQPSSNRPPR